MKLSDTTTSGPSTTTRGTRDLGIDALNGIRKPARIKRTGVKTATAKDRRPVPQTAIAPPPAPRVAVIGLGYWGPNLVRNFYSVLGENLRACCDRQSQRGKFILQNYPSVHFTDDIDSILADPDIDAVAIATPVDTHYPLAKAALTAGKSVLVEKPMCSTVEQAEELVDLAERNGKVLMVDHTFVYNPAVRKMKEIVDSGQLGELLFVDSIRINLGIFQHDVNVVWDLAPHDLSIVQYLVGRSPKSLSAFGAAHAGNGIESVAYINLDFGDGLIANFHVNWLSPVKIRHTVVGGRKRSLIYNDLDPIEKVKIYDSGITVRHDDLEGRRRQLIEYRTGDIWAPPHRPAGAAANHGNALHRVPQGTQAADDRRPGRTGDRADPRRRPAKHQGPGGRITL